MAVTLAEAKNNATEDLDVAVIDEFRKESVVLDSLVFDQAVNPAGGGATLDYGYRRLVTQPTADYRTLNSEYTPQNVTTTKESVTLAVMGGAFEVDRVIADIGPALSGAVSLNLRQKIKATNTFFCDQVINGDTAVDADGFDGLDKALTGSSTEMNPTTSTDWSALNTSESRLAALDLLDEFLGLLDGTPTLLLGNKALLAKIRSIVRGTGLYVVNPVDGLVGANGRPINREEYGGILFADPGDKAGSTSPIIPVESRDLDGAGANPEITNLTDLYAIRIGLDGFHGVTTTNGNLVKSWLPDFSTAGAVKKGEVELGPIGVALKATKAAAVLRNIKIK